MTRAAIYARFSNADLQSENSAKDQIRLCKMRAEGLGYTVVKEYADEGISGAHSVNRPELQQLLVDAAAGVFDILISESLDRISRNLKDIATIHEDLTFARVQLYTLSEGEVTTMHIGIMGTMGQLQLKQIAEKTKRGQQGRLSAGKVPSGLSYGYKVAEGTPSGLNRAIKPEEAEVIRRIFEDYAGGASVKEIAHSLNNDGIPSPTGGLWRPTTISGNKSRGSGILYNEAYIGKIVWNRISMVKNPKTGKRQSVPNPKDQWQYQEAPELRIIDDKTWNAVQNVKAKYAYLAGPQKNRRPKRLLSGLMECGVCGGTVTTVKGGHYGCSNRAQSGPSACSNNKFIKIDELDALVLGGIKERLLAPERIEEFITNYNAMRAEQRRQAVKEAGKHDRAIAEKRRKVNNLISMVEDGTAPQGVRDRLLALEAEIKSLEAQKAYADTIDDTVIEFHPGLAEMYRTMVDGLERELSEDAETMAQAADILRSIIVKVVITPGEKRGEQLIALHGAIPELLSLTGPTGPLKGLGEGDFSIESLRALERSKPLVAGGSYTPFRPLVDIIEIQRVA